MFVIIMSVCLCVCVCQLTLDAARVAFNEPRDAFRQRIMDEERQHQELLLAQEAALKAEQDKHSPSPSKGTSKKQRSPVGKKKK